MVWWRFSLLCTVVLVTLVTCSAIVMAADDTSGNIKVEITRLDKGVSFTTIVMLGMAVVILVLLISLMLLLRRSSSSARLPRPKRDALPVGTGIRVSHTQGSAFKSDGYYAAVFGSPKPDVVLSDERSEPVRFVENGAQESVERYLKEDERIVVNVLKMKHNSCSQATLRVVTDFSKARLSRIISELEERGVVYKEQQGRKNIITLKS